MTRSGLAALLAALSFLVVSGARAQVIEQLVATVDGEPIWASELVARVEERTPEAFRAELERMIEERVVRAEAARLHLTVDDAMMEQVIESVRLQNGLDEEPFWQAVEAEGLTRSEYRRRVHDQVLRARLVQLLAQDELMARDGEAEPDEREREARTAAAERRVMATLRERARVVVRM